MKRKSGFLWLYCLLNYDADWISNCQSRWRVEIVAIREVPGKKLSPCKYDIVIKYEALKK